MSETQAKQNPALVNTSISPRLEAAIRNWYQARYQFELESTKHNQDSYEIAFNELGQTISLWKIEQPELFEQFRFWFSAHLND